MLGCAHGIVSLGAGSGMDELSLRGTLEACSHPPFQVVYPAAAGERSVTVTYCQQVTPSEYQRQRLTGSQLFLAQLLDQLVENTGKLSAKERKRKLKEVRLGSVVEGYL